MIKITVISLGEGPPPADIAATFGAAGGCIGRGTGNALVLPDPERQISRIHASVFQRDGRFFIRDMGRAFPVHLNARALGQGAEHALSDGDEVRIGPYSMRVSDVVARPPTIDADTRAVGVGDAAAGVSGMVRPESGRLEPLFGDHEYRTIGISQEPGFGIVQPGMVTGFLKDPVIQTTAMLAPDANSIHDSAGRSTANEPLSGAPPEPSVAPPIAPLAEPAAAGHGTDENDLLALRDLLSPVAVLGSSGHPAAVREAIAPPVVGEATPGAPPAVEARAVEEDARTVALRPDVGMSLPPVTPAAASDATAPGQVFPDPEPKSLRLRDDATCTGGSAAVNDAPVESGADDPAALLRAFLAGADIEELAGDLRLTPGFMRLVGELLREAASGTLELLHARARSRQDMRADVTVIASRDNNPLKFSPDAQTALRHLLIPAGRAFVPPVQALRDAYNDLRIHEIGVAAGIDAAIGGLLDRFRPDELERRLTQKTVLDSLVPINRRAKLWELFTELHGDIAREAKADAGKLFGSEIRSAYEARTTPPDRPGRPV